MNGEIFKLDYPFRPEQLAGNCDFDLHRELVEFCMQSTEVYIGMYGRDVVCIMGIIAPSFLSQRAYVWLQACPSLANHKLAFARAARRWISSMRALYPVLWGHCDNGRSIAWLASLGATFTGAYDNHIYQFEIR